MMPYNAYEINQARIRNMPEGDNRERLADSARAGNTNPNRLVKLMRAVRHRIGDQPASEIRSTGEIASLPANE
jgi:hypothetical protein